MGGMGEPHNLKPNRPTAAGKPDRKARLAQALRANLKRRKQAGQARTPVAGPENGSGEES